MLVMFFVFHILVLTIPFCTSFPQRANSPDIASFSKGNVKIPSFKDGTSKNESTFRTQKPLFQIIKNLTKLQNNNNLKSNVFDKMLSEEMLSIKQRFFEKDLIQVPTTSKVKQNSAPTPTIEVQQKWSVVDLFTNPAFDEVVTKSTDDENDVVINNENSLESDLVLANLKSNNSVNKILELRSLPSVRHADPGQIPIQVSSCANHNIQVTPKCSCTRPDHQRCTQTTANNQVSYSMYPLYLQPYQTFFFSDNLNNPYENMYYHPNVVNDLKIPKKTKRRKTTPLPPDIYYDDSKNKIDEDEYLMRPRTKHPDVIMNIDYELVDDKSKDSNCKKSEGNNFNLINDLNEVFNEGVNKKCYCSLSTLLLPSQMNILYVFMIVHIFQYFHNKILFFD